MEGSIILVVRFWFLVVGPQPPPPFHSLTVVSRQWKNSVCLEVEETEEGGGGQLNSDNAHNSICMFHWPCNNKPPGPSPLAHNFTHKKMVDMPQIRRRAPPHCHPAKKLFKSLQKQKNDKPHLIFGSQRRPLNFIHFFFILVLISSNRIRG